MSTRRSIAALALAGALGLALQGRARAEDLPPPGKAPTARACVDAIIAYSKKGDIDSMCSFMVEPDRTVLPMIMKSMNGMDGSTDKLGKAMDAKWPGSSSSLQHRGPQFPTAKQLAGQNMEGI